MMTPDELQFLHYLTAKHYTSAGAILDFGPLAGASSFSLASGLGATGHIFSYDMWHFFPDWQRFFPQRMLQEGDDILPLFLEYVAAFCQHITPHKGDLSHQRWGGEPIEMIFIDAARSPGAMQHMVNEFLVYKRQFDDTSAILDKVLADRSFCDFVQYDVELVRSAMTR